MKGKIPGISKEEQKAASHQAYERTDYGRRAGGQNGDECADILMLLAAIRGGVNSLMARLSRSQQGGARF
jgi:hypothetical protein